MCKKGGDVNVKNVEKILEKSPLKLPDASEIKKIEDAAAESSTPVSHSDSSTDTSVVIEQKTEVLPPPLYKVLLHNDDYTPMDFVVMVLEKFFRKTHAEALEIMLSVHNKGLGVCGVFPYEIAETKVSVVLETAREHEHPLQCSMEKE